MCILSVVETIDFCELKKRTKILKLMNCMLRLFSFISNYKILKTNIENYMKIISFAINTVIKNCIFLFYFYLLLNKNIEGSGV